MSEEKVGPAPTMIAEGFYTPPGSTEKIPFKLECHTELTPEQLRAKGFIVNEVQADKLD